MQNPPSNPLHLLDDLLESLCENDVSATDPVSINSALDDVKSSSCSNDKQAKHDMVLRIASDLFINHGSLLESALFLLEEQERAQNRVLGEKNDFSEPNNDGLKSIPVIRKIRARRSGRVAILVRKQQRKSKSNSAHGDATKKNVTAHSHSELERTSRHCNKKSKSGSAIGDYYLCLLGKDQIGPRSLIKKRRGMHCTCRSYYQKMKGGNSNRLSTPDDSKSKNVLDCRSIDNAVLCKHLLASILMPHLLPWSENNGFHEEVVDDRMFAKMAIRTCIG